ncbi:protein of unknown function [Candidatus Hydrogenisulfobacillus filiaventi]|uniref:Uncharacterized protein n=1 Tax=Candidatus Hydrogenisulfobacillus filiaventi TaxID=2707344 RepID=A0A6F8ZFC8_9FIRM|nr:protein of unknown function [Candidatus Hydrogenisulfobacillus filiaventi]
MYIGRGTALLLNLASRLFAALPGFPRSRRSLIGPIRDPGPPGPWRF